MAMKRIMISLCAALTALCAGAQGGEVESILSHFRKIALYDSECTQEKVYLHLDNNAYFMGENVYFKAYVVRASSLKLTDMSKVLYVELLDDHGNTIERKNYEIDQGQASGSIPLSGIIHGGYYEIRAFTRAMLNWDGDYCFSRVVPVYQTDDTSGGYLNPYIPKHEGEDMLPWLRKEPGTMRSDSVRHNGVYAEFYPEGGALVQTDAPQKVAFRITDKSGNPLTGVECSITDGQAAVATAKTEHEGMGEIVIPSWKSGLRAVVRADGKQREFALPAARQSGLAATIERTGADSLALSVKPTSDLAGKYIGVSVTCRGAGCVFDTLRLAADGSVSRWRVSERNLHFGINQITLFNADGNKLWERLVWRKPDYPVSLEVRQNQESYQPFSPVVLNMKLANKNGAPQSGYFSISVRDRGFEFAGRDCGIEEDLLLSSDIKGYVARPEEYFEADDETHARRLDLLLLVQGWRRYDFDEMTGKKPFKLLQPVETGQLITGYLLSDNHKRLPMGGAYLKADIYLGTTHAKGTCRTDSAGGFAIMPPKYYGNGIGRFYTYQNKDGKEKPKAMRVVLDREFAPKPRLIDIGEFSLADYRHDGSVPATDYTFEWEDTIPKDAILLGAAKVKGRRADQADGQDKWNGGEGFAQRNADICYNIDLETMRYCDKGEDIPLLWDLLKSINKNFDYYTSDADIAGTNYEFTYRGRPAVIFRRNTEQSGSEHMDNMTIFANEVNRVYIVTDQEKVRRVLPGYGSSDGREKVAIMLYGGGVSMMMKDKSKTKVVSFYGYSVDDDFPLPDYRARDLPDKRDFRRTLYWNPDVLADENGKASVMFYTNADENVKLGITARAVLPDGQLLEFNR